MRLKKEQLEFIKDYEQAQIDGFTLMEGDRVPFHQIEVEDWYYLYKSSEIFKKYGKQGGDSTAKRGSEYYKDLANKRWKNNKHNS